MAPFDEERDNTDLTNLIINYLPQNMTDKELHSMFVTIGQVDSCRVMRDNKTGYSYGFGFVNYVKKEDATKAIQQLNGLQIQNKTLKVSYARPSSEDIKDTNVYITNLPRTITEDQLEQMFGGFGKIVQKNILKDKITGLPRGVAFVRYDKKSEAMDAVNEMNEKVPEGGTEALIVKIAEEHGKHKAAYYAGFHAGYSQSRGGGANNNYKRNGGAVNSVVGGGRGTYHQPLRAPLYANMYTPAAVMRNAAGGVARGAGRQDKALHRYNPVGMTPANVGGYNLGGGYY